MPTIIQPRVSPGKLIQPFTREVTMTRVVVPSIVRDLAVAPDLPPPPAADVVSGYLRPMGIFG